jgi:parallel beta-helix repeat protein
MAVNLSPIGGVAGQFFDNNGNPLSGGKLYTYAASTTTPQATYTNSSGATANSNPIILNSGGRVPAEIWLTDGLAYKFVLYTSTDTLIGSWDNIIGINSNFVNFVTSEEVQTATAGQTVFTLTTMQYQPGLNNLVVYVDGVNQVEGGTYSYVETSSTVVTFTAGLHLGAIVKFVSAETLTTIGSNANVIAYDPAGAGAVTTTVQAKLRESVSVKDFGAVGDGVTDDTAAIQAAVDAMYANGGGTVFFPDGIYGIGATPIQIKDNVTLTGNGKNSTLKLTTTLVASCIRSDVLVSNIAITDLGFDGSLYYPTTSDVDPTTTNDQYGIRLTDCINVKVSNCYFNEFTRSSITIFAVAISSENILINNNFIYKGGYSNRAIYIATNAPAPQNIQITNNFIDTVGPAYFYDASVFGYTPSGDGIGLDNCDSAIISNNTISNTSGYGIRIEQSFRVTVIGNTIRNPGAGGVTFYLDCREGACVGNSIFWWGKIPPADAVRDYSGTYYYATEYVASTPVDPSIDARFAVWPYALTNVNLATIQPYVVGVALLPFRGFAALSATHRTRGITFSNNFAEGNLTQASGKYVYASDYGYTPVHYVNTATFDNGIECSVIGNRFRNSRLYDIYQPTYMNPVANNAVNGGKVTFCLLEGTTKLIENVLPSANYVHATTQNQIAFPATQVPSANANTLDDYAEGTFDAAFSSAGGSVTINPSFTKMMYTKIGRLVTITGQVRVSAISSPTGEVAITGLPFANTNTPQQSPSSACFVLADNVGAFDVIVGTIPFGQSKIILYKKVGGATQDISSNITSTSSFTLCISYHASA